MMQHIDKVLSECAVSKKPQNSSSVSIRNDARELTARFQNIEQFMQVFNPDKQPTFCRDEKRCVMGNCPELSVIEAVYGTGSAVMWLIPQLVNLAEYSGCTNKMSPMQLEMCAQTIYTTYYHLKATELMLFFLRFKAGMYGHFYGSVDPIVIMDGLKQFMQYRDKIFYAVEKQKSQEETARIAYEISRGMNIEQWQQWKEKHKEEYKQLMQKQKSNDTGRIE